MQYPADCVILRGILHGVSPLNQETREVIHEPQEHKETFWDFLWEVIKIALIALLIIIPIRYYVVQPFIVRGDSMLPNFHNRDYLLIDELSFHRRDPLRGEVVVFKLPQDPRQYYIKRVIGLPGETVIIRDGAVTIQNDEHPEGFTLTEAPYLGTTPTPGDKTTHLKEDEYFVMGDNRTRSSDSRSFGGVNKKYIVGRVWVRGWPAESAKVFSVPSYSTTTN